MISPHLLRWLLAAFCALQGMATLVLDLNRTHAAHPQWLGHARFHVVWQAFITALLAMVEIALVLFSGPFVRQRFYLTTILAALPVIGFFGALVARRLYRGTLHDPQGIPPWIVWVQGSRIAIDLNLVAEIAAVCVLAVLATLFHHTAGH